MPVDPVVRAVVPSLVEDGREFHARPALARQEAETARARARRIKAQGVLPEPVDAALAVPGRGGRSPGRPVAVRADRDGLPIEEAGGPDLCLRHADVPGACADDVRMATALSGMRTLVDRRDEVRPALCAPSSRRPRNRRRQAPCR